MTVDLPVWLPAAFFLVAFLYSIAGFAGGSSYLAILILSGLAYQQVPLIALFCNLIVSAGTFFHFYKGGHFDFKKALPWILFSIPMAFVGGKMQISRQLFFILLGLSLFAAGTRMLFADKEFETSRIISTRELWLVGLPAGAALGFLSGLVGIGGGIFLSPLLLLMRWVQAKQAAAIASFFIFVNSLSGLLGQAQKTVFPLTENLIFLGLAVFLGGQIGSSLGAYHLPRLKLQRVAAALILYVSIDLIRKAFL